MRSRRTSSCAAIATANSSKRPSSRASSRTKRRARRKEPNGTFIEFEPDPEIFKDSEFQRRTHRAPAAPLQLSQHRPEADLQRPRLFQSRHGLMDLVMEDLAGRRQRADLSAAALHEQDAGVLFHAQQQPLRRNVLFLRQRPVHQRRRHAPERVPRRPAQGGERIRARASSKATTCANAWSARWRSA